MDEKKLIIAIQSGSEKAFYELVDEYKNMVFHTCFGFLQNAEEAEDLAQEVFIEVFESIKKFNGKSKLSTWIYRIASNKSLDLIKYKNRKRRFASVMKVFGVDYEADAAPQLHDYNPQEEIENDERAKILHWAINQLSENQQKAFILNKYDDMPYAEIAEMMEMSVSAIEALLHRAKKKLQVLLRDFYEAEKKIN
ncbi:MAG: RNA polymerase sigma factor [Bacteroidales bacterium]|nr:RNA polymerase sigma factor [Bacteroidales bacterium]